MAKGQIANYIIKFVLTNFFGSRVQMVEDENGEMEECVCIPLERNDLKKNKRGQVTSYFFMTKSDCASMYGWTHYLKQKVNPEFLKRMDEWGWKLQYMGNAKESNYVVYKKEYQQKFVKANDDE